MKLEVINSDSSGNCYVLGNIHTAIMLDCGVKFRTVQEAMNFSLMRVKLCVITHEHQDHCRSFKQISACGIPSIASQGTYDAMGVSVDNRPMTIAHGQKRTYNGWTVYALEAKHDAREPLLYIIEHPGTGPVLFVTDSYLMPHDLRDFKFETVIIEANYCEDLAREIREKKGDNFVDRRRVKSHMSIQTALLTLSRLDLNNCRNIVLIHLSYGLSDANRFRQMVEDATGIKATVADAGVEVELLNY